MTIREALNEGIRQLSRPCPGALIQTPGLDASLFMACTLAVRREELIIRENEQINENDRIKFANLIKRRINGECTAYILGKKEFYGLEFTVNPAVLVPRPETETLVESAIEICKSLQKEITSEISVLDLCTGSGAAAIVLKHEIPEIRVSASDISAEALAVACENSIKLLGKGEGRDDPVNFIKSDLFENINSRFHLIVSNPPYVKSGDIGKLAPEVRQEPLFALNGGKDGLAIIRRIIGESPDHLYQGGYLLMEADPRQMNEIKTLMETNGFRECRIIKDLSGNARVLKGIHY